MPKQIRGLDHHIRVPKVKQTFLALSHHKEYDLTFLIIET
jgi:hypothetical protein